MTRLPRALLAPIALLALAACAPEPEPRSFLYVSAADSAGQAADFLAVVNADTPSRQYGAILSVLPTGAHDGHPHHTEDLIGPSGHLLANAFGSGTSYLFDLSTPGHPALLTSFGDVGGFSHPHSYFRTADGNVLATFQYRATGQAPAPMAGHDAMNMGGTNETGGLVEMDERGNVRRSASAADPRIRERGLFPYSVLQLTAMDRAVSTTTNMDVADTTSTGEWIQFWRLSDLTLLRSLRLSPGPRGNENQYTGEPRLLPDGKSVYIHTFACGLYLVRGADTDRPAAQLVASFNGMWCGVPVQTGRWWIQPVPADHALLTLDISDPEHPREVARLLLPGEEPHWLAVDPSGTRLVVNSGGHGDVDRLYVVMLDPATGALTLDSRFRDSGSDLPGIAMKGRTWPHGFTGTAVPHGTVFSR